MLKIALCVLNALFLVYQFKSYVVWLFTRVPEGGQEATSGGYPLGSSGLLGFFVQAGLTGIIAKEL